MKGIEIVNGDSQSLRSQGIDSDLKPWSPACADSIRLRNPFVVRASIRTEWAEVRDEWSAECSQSLRSQGIDSDPNPMSGPLSPPVIFAIPS